MRSALALSLAFASPKLFAQSSSDSAPKKDESALTTPTLPKIPASECKSEASKIRQEVKKARRCLTHSDCVEGKLGCPFGCSNLVNQKSLPQLEALSKRYSESCGACEYKCLPPTGKPYCLRNHCVWKD